MSSEVLTPQEKKIQEKVKRDSIVLDSMAEIVVASETILKSLDKMRNAGSSLYRHKFKQLSNQYRKECVNVLNQYYDFMATGGVADAFVTQMKELAMIHNALGELDYMDVRKVGLYIGELLTPEEEPEDTHEVQEEEMEALEEEWVDSNETIEEEEELTYEDVLGEDFEAPEETILDKMIKPVGVTEEAEDITKPAYEPVSETFITVTQNEFSEIQYSHAQNGVHEDDLIKKTLDSIAVRKGIDTDIYVFSKADQIDDNIVLKFKLK